MTAISSSKLLLPAVAVSLTMVGRALSVGRPALSLHPPVHWIWQPRAARDCERPDLGVSSDSSARIISEISGGRVGFPGMEGPIWGFRVDLGCQIGSKAGEQIIGGRLPETFSVPMAPPWG